MEIVNNHEAKPQLSKLVERAARGEPSVIAKAGKPLDKVVPLNQPKAAEAERIGFMKGQIQVPDDFDTVGTGEIATLFAAGS